jgi:hypothetical protein
MNKFRLAGTAVAVLIVALVAFGQGFKVYPGAEKYMPPDNEETRQAKAALPPGTTATYYTTNDGYEKVVGFYKTLGKEYSMPGMPKDRRLPSGQVLKQTFFIFDGAADLGSSKSWAKVQRPLIGSITLKGAMPEYHDIRDVTSITVAEKK